MLEIGRKGLAKDVLSGRRVLVLEDDYFLAHEVVCMLREAGAVVLGPACSVKGGLELLKSHGAPDAAISDVNLSDGTAYPVTDTLRGLGVPFLFATAAGRAALPERYADVCCLEKPVDTLMLLMEIESLLTHSRDLPG
jgi:CheY-like chemotaxis protein